MILKSTKGGVAFLLDLARSPAISSILELLFIKLKLSQAGGDWKIFWFSRDFQQASDVQGEGKPETDIPLHPHLGFQRKAIFGIMLTKMQLVLQNLVHKPSPPLTALLNCCIRQ